MKITSPVSKQMISFTKHLNRGNLWALYLLTTLINTLIHFIVHSFRKSVVDSRIQHGGLKHQTWPRTRFYTFSKKSLEFLDFLHIFVCFMNLKEINMVDFKQRDPLECAIRNF